MVSFRNFPKGLSVLVFLGLIMPLYSFISGDFIWLFYGVIFAGVLFIVKWRWWWQPLRENLGAGKQQD